jgi:hypothetical protein
MNTLWLTIACTLAIFNYTKAKDKEGNEVPIIAECTDGTTRSVLCWIVPPPLVSREPTVIQSRLPAALLPETKGRLSSWMR